MKLYIKEAIETAMGGDVKGAFAVLFQDVEGPEAFFADLIAYLRGILGIEKDY